MQTFRILLVENAANGVEWKYLIWSDSKVSLYFLLLGLLEVCIISYFGYIWSFKRIVAPFVTFCYD